MEKHSSPPRPCARLRSPQSQCSPQSRPPPKARQPTANTPLSLSVVLPPPPISPPEWSRTRNTIPRSISTTPIYSPATLPLSFLKKAVIALTEGATLVAPSPFKQDSLPNDYAETVGCTTIRSLLGTAAPGPPAFIEGFVVIIVPPASSPNQLDVTAVYTSSNNPPTSLQVVPIAVRIITPPPAGAALDGRSQ